MNKYIACLLCISVVSGCSSSEQETRDALASLINLAAWDKTNRELNEKEPKNSVEKPVFIEPVPKIKGEYEKTAHFNKRVADDLEWARTKYNERIELYKHNVAESNKEYEDLVKNKDKLF